MNARRELEGRVAMIAGASRDFGLAIAQALALSIAALSIAATRLAAAQSTWRRRW